MNEQLRIRLGEYLLSKGIKFTEVDNLQFDDDSCTLDIWYKVGAKNEYHEMSSEIIEFAEFLVSGGN